MISVHEVCYARATHRDHETSPLGRLGPGRLDRCS